MGGNMTNRVKTGTLQLLAGWLGRVGRHRHTAEDDSLWYC